MSKFTKSSTTSGVYEDMRGFKWGVYKQSALGNWKAALLVDAYGYKADPKRVLAAGSDAGMVIDAIEDFAERVRVANKGKHGWLWLLVIGYAVTRKGRK